MTPTQLELDIITVIQNSGNAFVSPLNDNMASVEVFKELMMPPYNYTDREINNAVYGLQEQKLIQFDGTFYILNI
jgi:hypothetical protein